MQKKIAIIGLGYVGLPLAVEFGKKYQTIGYDININRINELSIEINKYKELQRKTNIGKTLNNIQEKTNEQK